MITTDEQNELEKIAKKYESVNKLLEWYKEVKRGLWADAYVSMAVQIKTFLQNLEEYPMSLNNDKDDKGFDRSDKVLLNMKEYLTNLNYISKQMLPEEVEAADKKAQHSWDIARKKIDEITVKDKN
jgi:hypothetical protein